MKSKYFKREEFSCSDQCGFNAVDIDLLEGLTAIRKEFGPVIIHCACRCKTKNDEVGSKDTSQHLRGMAADFHINGVDNDKIAFWIDSKYPESHGVGIYDWGVHFDVRKKKARWDKRE